MQNFVLGLTLAAIVVALIVVGFICFVFINPTEKMTNAQEPPLFTTKLQKAKAITLWFNAQPNEPKYTDFREALLSASNIAEYWRIKTLYFSGKPHSMKVENVLALI